MEYTPRRKDKREREPECFLLDDFPTELNKKVTLLKHFQNYLESHHSDGFLQDIASEWNSTQRCIPFVKKWLKTRHAIVFRVSNRIVQVSFFDNSAILMATDGDQIAYVNKQQQCVVHTVQQGEEAPTADMEKRLKYAREILVTLSMELTRAPLKA